MGRRGRSNAAMLARLGRILLLLSEHPLGIDTAALREQVGYGDGPVASQMRALNRDLATLAHDGWQIDAVMVQGNKPARRVLRTVDNRFATLFTASQRAQLARAAACAGPRIADALANDLGRAVCDDVPFTMPERNGSRRLAIAQSAVAGDCRLAFTYAGKRRVTLPVAVLLPREGWYLRACDTADGRVKTFAIDRMSNLRKGVPGSSRPDARTRGQAQAAEFDPLGLHTHDSFEVRVLVSEEFEPEVTVALVRGEGLRRRREDGFWELSFQVTNSSGLLARVVELGERVRLLGPPELRAQLRAQLSAAGAAR